MIRPFVQILIVLVTLAVVSVGGAGNLVPQTALAAISGLFLIAAPPRGPLPRTPLLLAGLFLFISLLAFIPAGSSLHTLDATPWRKYLISECHISPASSLGRPPSSEGPVASFPIDNTWSPQPWLTAQACGLLFLGLAWALYLLTLPWEREDRIRTAEMLVFGVALLALLAVLAFVLHFHVPGWTQEQNRGWFPNRNQTADVLALIGIVTYALIFDRLRKGKRIGYLLLAALVPIVIELVISYSRAGIILFFGGLLAWHIWPRQIAGHRRGVSPKWLALSAALGMLMLAVFLTWGGDTLARFQADTTSASTAVSDFTDFRGAIQEDAFWFSLQSPYIGTGLGNFEPLFSFSRVASINQNRAIHPESDWLWLACEMGWPAVAVVVAACVWWFRRALPLENKAGESMRRALIVAFLVFLVHGLVDVSAHGPGTLWVALLIAGMALPEPRVRSSPATPLLFRGLGVALLLLAGCWFGSIHGLRGFPPTTAMLARFQSELASGTLSPSQTVNTVNAALKIAPLDWTLYLQRGAAEIGEEGNMDAAQADFATARALNPYWMELTIDEGKAWSAVGQPDLAIDAWSDGLRRLGPAAPEAFREMIGLAMLHSVERQGLVELAFNNVDYLLSILPGATLDEADAMINHLLQADPQLSKLDATQRSKLFAAWWTQGNQVQMMQLLRDHPEWEKENWIYEADFAAKENDYQRACEIMAQHVLTPVIPQSNSVAPLGEMVTYFASNPDDLGVGLDLALAQMKAGQNDAALETLGQLVKIPDHPRYLSYVQAQLYTSKQDWVSAWQAWQSYLQP
jgi:hypothetical protein